MTAIGLKSQIWNNNLRSMLLLAVYPFLIAGIVWLISVLIGWTFSYGASGSLSAISANGGGTALKALQTGVQQGNHYIVQWWPAIFALVGIWFMIAYFFQAKMIRALSHAHPVTREEEPELYNLLENLCISRGMRMPQLEIIETHARNAFASGIDQNSYRITVTRGLLQSLEKDEVEAVLGHELSHIRHGDVRLLIVSVIFTGMIGFFAQLAWSSIRFNLYAGRRRSDIRVMIVLMLIVGILWLGYMATMFTRFALSRRREFMADAGSVELTHNPEAMMRALLRISGKDHIPQATDDIALMCIENSHKFFGLFATHPPLEERIAAISQVSGVPVPDLRPGFRTDDDARFAKPADHNNPWLSATREKRPNPWIRKETE